MGPQKGQKCRKLLRKCERLFAGVIREFSNDTSYEIFRRPTNSGRCLLLDSQSRHFQRRTTDFRNHSFVVRRIFTVERKIISVSDFSNSILSHEIELNFGTFFLTCLDLCMKYISISFDARRASEEKG